MFLKKPRYCAWCGGKVEKREEKLICTQCKRRIWLNPLPTVDIIIEKGEGVVLINRKNPPPGWALPGGFIEYGETAEEAALREAKEETNLEISDLTQFKVYSHPERDPRFHTISIVFSGRGKGKVKPSSEVREVKVFRKEAIPWKDLAFDHKKILKDYFFRERR